MGTMTKAESALAIREAEGKERFPWDRREGESYAAFSRFVLYRNTPPGERSMRKLGVSGTTAFRWAKRWQWTARTSAYDLWQLELSDGLANHNAAVHRRAVVRFTSASLSKATSSVAKLNETKLTVDDVVNLAKTGVQLERQALGMADGETRLDRAPVANVAISLGSTPPWLTGPANDGQVNAMETEPKAVVPCAEQVIAGGSSASSQAVGVNVKRLAEKIVKSPKAGNK